uniref:Store-operated calcium entry-associated regulatory factor n=1 Tax=Phallusia mammillata TaxID=59560 RepID=A0A6F9DS84_9ASCI|nr:store-operated calcium entry-associated regulatory factor-like [Phallusia mammillata]
MEFKCFLILVVVCLFVVVTKGWMGSEDDKVLLRDVSAITLYPNRMTTGRRSSPVPQMKCVGGTAGCSKFTPSVVQCKNVGSDGFDVQWECKADMDDSYRFGKIQVSCEGYNHPNDPYVLKGSCGLEYTIDLTEAGQKRHQNSWNSYYQPSKQYSSSVGGGGSWFIFFIIVFAIVFLIRKMTTQNDDVDSSQRRPSPSRGPPYPSQHHGPSAPPTYGFKPEYTRDPPSYQDATHTGEHNSQSSYTGTQTGTRNANASPFGGFWSGMGLGSLAGYFFGSRNNHNRGYGYGGYGNGYGNGYGGGYGGFSNGWGSRRGWGGGGGSSWSSSSSSSSRSSSSSPGSSRTASGFGGTTRR